MTHSQSTIQNFSLPRYPRYRDSGVEWLGEIPAHWEVCRNLGVFDERKECNQPEAEMLSVTVSQGIIRQSEITTKKDSSNEDKSKYKVVRVGDLAYNKMRAWQGALGISDYDGIVSPAYVVLSPRNRKLSKYFHYLYRTPQFITEANRLSYGLCDDMNSLRYEHFKTSYSPLPPDEETNRIVAFLDQKTAEIDTLISKKQRQIELLDEQIAILINRAVTRGLNPNATLKPSGIDWLPHIPKEWASIKLRHLAAMIQTGPFGSQLHSEEYVENGIPVVNPSHMKDGTIVPDLRCTVSEKKATFLAKHKLQLGDILFARRGELGRCAVVTEHELGWLCGTGSLLFRPKPDVFDSAYLVQVLSDYRIAASLTLQSVGSTMDNLNTAMIADLSVPLPPTSEQRVIMQAIGMLKDVFHTLGQQIESQIQSLKTLRSTLIAHAVTGSIQVK